MSIGDRMDSELKRQMNMLEQAVDMFADAEGNPPPWMSAQADQLYASAAALAEVLIGHVKEHVAENNPCCHGSNTCVGVELMMGTSVAFKEAPTQMIPATWSMLGRVARAEMKVAELEEKLKGEADGK